MKEMETISNMEKGLRERYMTEVYEDREICSLGETTDIILYFIEQEIDRTREEVVGEIEEILNAEIKSGNIKVLKKNDWFKKLSKLKDNK